MKKPLIVSTKKLNFPQRERLLSAQLAVQEYNAIRVETISFNVPTTPAHWVFSSQNAVQAVLEKKDIRWADKTLFCVGEKTKNLLEKNGKKVAKMTQNMQELVDFIEKKLKKNHFLHFCGNIRLPLFSAKLTALGIPFSETVVYHTFMQRKKIFPPPDGILFFSPSGVQSYVSQNNIGSSVCFCIGHTTASQLTIPSAQVLIASFPAIEQVIQKTVKYYRSLNHD